MNERICAHCGAAFIGAITARYCGPGCQKNAERERSKREPFIRNTGPTCVYCGSPMTPKHPARRYCGAACKQAAHRARLIRRKCI